MSQLESVGSVFLIRSTLPPTPHSIARGRVIGRGGHKHRRINFFPAGRRDVGKQKAVEPRPKGRRNAARRYVSEREAARGLEGRAPSDTATATTAGATAGPGETLNSLQGRTGNEHRFVCSRNERTLRAPCAAIAAWRPRCLPSGALSPLPGGPRGKRSRRVEEEEEEEVEDRLDGGCKPRDTTGQRDTLVYSINPSRVHTPVPDNSRGYAITIDRFAMPSCAFRFLRFFALSRGPRLLRASQRFLLFAQVAWKLKGKGKRFVRERMQNCSKIWC